MLYDCEQGTLSYYRDGTPLGVAFNGLNTVQEDLFPVMASCQTTEMTLEKRMQKYGSLQALCRMRIVRELSDKSDADKLGLPTFLKEFITN